MSFGARLGLLRGRKETFRRMPESESQLAVHLFGGRDYGAFAGRRLACRRLRSDFHAEMADGRNSRTGKDVELTGFARLKNGNIFYYKGVILSRITNFAANFKI